jgi:hypothetical protein
MAFFSASPQIIYPYRSDLCKKNPLSNISCLGPFKRRCTVYSIQFTVYTPFCYVCRMLGCSTRMSSKLQTGGLAFRAHRTLPGTSPLTWGLVYRAHRTLPGLVFRAHRTLPSWSPGGGGVLGGGGVVYQYEIRNPGYALRRAILTWPLNPSTYGSQSFIDYNPLKNFRAVEVRKR